MLRLGNIAARGAGRCYTDLSSEASHEESEMSKIEEIRKTHVERVTHTAWGEDHSCAGCNDDWPCDTAVALAEIDTLLVPSRDGHTIGWAPLA